MPGRQLCASFSWISRCFRATTSLGTYGRAALQYVSLSELCSLSPWATSPAPWPSSVSTGPSAIGALCLLFPSCGLNFSKLPLVAYSAITSNGPSQSGLLISLLEQSMGSAIPKVPVLPSTPLLLKGPFLLIPSWPLCLSNLPAEQPAGRPLSVI